MKLKIGLGIVPQRGEMALMRQRWVEAEELGVDSIWTADHFHCQKVLTQDGGPQDTLTNHVEATYPTLDPDGLNFEAMTIQAAMAATTSRVEVGCLVHAIGYRNPNLLADMARTINHISGGRYTLGLGTGYFQKDYDEYGYPFGTAKSRMDDLERDLPIIVDRFGKLKPPPVKKLPVLLATMGPRGIKLVARYADKWHIIGKPEQMAEKIARMKDACAEIGRDPAEIELMCYHMPERPGLDIDPMEFVKLGITHLVNSQHGPNWDLGPVREILRWRDSLA